MEENGEAENNWTIKKIEHYMHCVKDLSLKREKYLNKIEKTKTWTIEGTLIEEDKTQEQVIMIEEEMCWNVGYQQEL